VRTNKEVRQRREVGQEVGDGAPGQSERRVRRVGIGEALRPEDVEADEHLDMRHRAELAGLDAPQDLLRAIIKDVVVVLNEVAANLLRPPDQCLQLFKGRCGGFLRDDVGAGIKRVHGEPEVGRRGCSDVDHVGPDLLQHGAVVGEPGLDPVPLSGGLRGGGREVADSGQLDARQGLDTRDVLPRDLPGSD
jgi:hypothetical protein